MVSVHLPAPHRPAARPRWIEPLPTPAEALALHIDPLLAALLHGRNLRAEAAVADFLRRAPRPTPNPWLLPNLEAAVERIAGALERAESIAIFGDYDVDGVASTALLARALRAAHPAPHRVVARLPLRADGYGLNESALDDFAAAGVELLIAVDCGSTDHHHISYAHARGLDVIAIDHHYVGGAAPDGAIVVSAYLAPEGPYRELSAVGVAYLVVAALAQHGCRVGGPDGDPETALLDYVALGTIGDVSPLIGPNRALVRDGLRRMRERPRAGLLALCRKAGLDPTHLTADRVAFKIVPRLNAAGRMSDPHVALDLMLTDNPSVAAKLAEEIERLNNDRRVESRRIAVAAEQQILAQPGWEERRVLIATGRDWSGGVLGIAANQLVERFGRPVFVLADDGEVCKGSARSVPGFDIVEALGRCANLLLRSGGHGQAAGVALASANLLALNDALDRELDALGLDVPIEPALRLDAELPVERLTIETAHLLDQLQPFGAGNEQPLLLVRAVEVRQYDVIGQDRSHLRLLLGSPASRGLIKAVAFGAADRSRELLLNRRLDLACNLNLDHWNGQTRLDVEVKDFRAAR